MNIKCLLFILLYIMFHAIGKDNDCGKSGDKRYNENRRHRDKETGNDGDSLRVKNQIF